MNNFIEDWNFGMNVYLIFDTHGKHVRIAVLFADCHFRKTDRVICDQTVLLIILGKTIREISHSSSGGSSIRTAYRTHTVYYC